MTAKNSYFQVRFPHIYLALKSTHFRVTSPPLALHPLKTLQSASVSCWRKSFMPYIIFLFPKCFWYNGVLDKYRMIIQLKIQLISTEFSAGREIKSYRNVQRKFLLKSFIFHFYVMYLLTSVKRGTG